jgi:8-oxo-dGTP pyrophosphatase MutT (NUDIX family)
LQVKRAAGIPGGGGVCFPTGTVEPGETLLQAVVREAAEELGVTVRVVAPLGHALFPGERVFGFEVEIVSGQIEPAPEEISEIFWLSPSEIATHPDRLPPSEVFAARLG